MRNRFGMGKALLWAGLIVGLVGTGQWVVARGEHPMEGKPAPAINLKTLDGQPFSLGGVKTEVVVLDFWATWCPPCRKGLPLLQQFHDWAKENKKSVSVYTINLQEDAKKVRSFWESQGLTMPVVMDTDGRAAGAYGVTGIPQTVVIHRKKIASVHVGYSPQLAEILKAETEQLLGN